MERDESSPSGLPIAGIFVALAVVGGAVLVDKPYLSLRPERQRPLLDEDAVGGGVISVALWEDPLQAVRDHIEARDSEDGEHFPEDRSGVTLDPHSIGFLSDALLRQLGDKEHTAEDGDDSDEPPPSVLVLPVLIPGNQSPIDDEARIRERHAVVSALGSSGYIPSWSRRLAFVETHWLADSRPIAADLDSRRKTGVELIHDPELIGAAQDLYSVPIPFEWFEIDTELAGPNERRHEQQPQRVLVLWFDASVLGSSTISGFDQFLTALVGRAPALQQALYSGDLEVRAMGPPDSGTLDSLLANLFDPDAPHRRSAVLDSALCAPPDSAPDSAPDSSPVPAPEVAQPFTFGESAFFHPIAHPAVTQAVREGFEDLGRRIYECSVGPVGTSADEYVRTFSQWMWTRWFSADGPGLLELERQFLIDLETDSERIRSVAIECAVDAARAVVNGTLALVEGPQAIGLSGSSAQDLKDAVGAVEAAAPNAIAASIGDVVDEVLEDWIHARFVAATARRNDASGAPLPAPNRLFTRHLIRSVLDPGTLAMGEAAAPSPLLAIVEARRDSADRLPLASFLPWPADSEIVASCEWLYRAAHQSPDQPPSSIEVPEAFIETLLPELTFDESRNLAPTLGAFAQRLRDQRRQINGVAREALSSSTDDGSPSDARTDDALRAWWDELHAKLDVHAPSLDRPSAVATPDSTSLLDLANLTLHSPDPKEWVVLRHAVVTHLTEEVWSSLEVMSELRVQTAGASGTSAASPPRLDDWFEALTEGLANGFISLLAPRPGEEATAARLSEVWTRRAAREARLDLVLSTAGVDPLGDGMLLDVLDAFLAQPGLAAIGRDPSQSEALAQRLLDSGAFTPKLDGSPSSPAELAEGICGWLIKSVAERRVELLGACGVTSRDPELARDPAALALVRVLARFDAGVAKALAPWSSRTLALEFQSRLKHAIDTLLPDSFARSETLEELAATIEHRRRSSTGMGARLQSTLDLEAEILASVRKNSGHQIQGQSAAVIGQVVADWINDALAVRDRSERGPLRFYPGVRLKGPEQNERELPAIDVPSRLGCGLPSILPHLTFFNGHATADLERALETALVGRWPEVTSLADVNLLKLKEALPIVHTVATDRELLGAIRDELKLRGFRQDRHAIAVVAEWDTVYGRRLPRQLAEEVLGPEQARRVSATSPDFRTFHYLRGLDGATPKRPIPRPGASASTGDSQGEPDLERSEGPSQFDYVRRLTNSLSRFARELERDSEQRELFAIGVLGGDVYDKLLIVQALRERFPSTLFFTTSHDSRLFHGPQRDWIQNLVVSSSFGLEAGQELQPDLPPFRDAYQTATFVATRLALGGVEWLREDPESEGSAEASGDRPSSARVRWGGHFQYEEPFDIEAGPVGTTEASWTGESFRATPQIFEVGRKTIVPLTKPTPSTQRPLAVAYGAAELPHLGYSTVLVVIALLALTLLASSRTLLVNLAGQTKVLPFAPKVNPNDRLKLDVKCALVVVTLAFASYPILLLAENRGWLEEPLYLAQGVSIWPTVLTRILTIGLALLIFAIAQERIERCGDEVARRLGYDPIRSRGDSLREDWNGERKRGTGRALAMGKVLLKELVLTWRFDSSAKAEGDDGIWLEYRKHSQLARRVVRAIVPATVFAIAAIYLVDQNEPSMVHVRGTTARIVERLTFYLMSFLLTGMAFVVIDATRLFERFVTTLTKPENAWSKGNRARSAASVCTDARCADAELDMFVIEREGVPIARLVLLPFTLFALCFVARNAYFDRLPWAPSIVFVGCLLIFLLASAAILARNAALRARERKLTELERITAQARSALALEGSETPGDGKGANRPPSKAAASGKGRRQGPPPERVLADAEHVRAQIESMSKGVFSPYHKSPLVQALLLPFGGAGFVAFLDWAVTAWS